MKYIPRQIESELLLASKHFSGLILTGPRRAGKTTLLRKLFPKARQLYYFRDQQGLEVDFLVPGADHKLILLEAKASRTVWPETAESLSRLSKVVSNYKVDRFLIYRPSKGKESISALRPGIKALSIEKLLSALS